MRYLVMIIGMMLFTSCGNESQPSTLPPVEIVAYTVVPQTIPANMEFVGVAQSSHLVEILARVEGYLNDIVYTEGTLVNKDDVLFKLDPLPFIAALNLAKAELANQEAILWNATRTKERFEPLFEQKAASRRDLDNAIASELSAQAGVEAAKAKVQEAELDLGYTTITAPVKGLAGSSKYRIGTLITPGAKAELTTISVLDPIWINFSVSDSELLRTRTELSNKSLVYPKDENFTVEVTLSDGSIFPCKGKVDFASPSLDLKTGTMSVRAVFSNPEMLIKPGQFVRATVIGATRPNAIIVPQKAVQQGRKGMYVYVVTKDNKAEMRLIDAGPWYNSYWVINSGLNSGDIVVVEGVNKIQPGSTVTITKEVK